ncbi:MAG: OmpA family protein [Candidatus Hydrogenedentes bacterium]|nr:OmpA family protein [Candidatus Hydrogenedentota bacterium]
MKKVVMLALMAALVAGTAQAAKVWDDMSWWGNTGATPEPYKCVKHPGYWWWPTVPASNADDGELWGNRGIVYSMWEPAAPPAEQIAAPPAQPEAPPVRTAILMNNVLFDFDSAVLKPEGKAEIDKLVEAMKQYPGDTVVVLGHCCNIGTDAYNMGLGQRRADSVKAYMVQQGVAAERIQSVSKGETSPLNDNSTPALRALNRRAEFQITVVN